MDYKLDVRSAKKMKGETLSKLHDFITLYRMKPVDIAEVVFDPDKQRVTFAVIQRWADGGTAYVDGETVVDDITKPCKPELMLPFLAYAHPQVKTTK